MIKVFMRFRRKLCFMLHDTRGARDGPIVSRPVPCCPQLKRFNPAFFPAVNFEINTDCNDKCPFRPQSSAPRPARYITMDGFLHVINALSRLNFSSLLVLAVNNEPFLHPLLIDFCRIASERLPLASICLFSNGSLVTAHHLQAFASLERPPHITVDDYTPAQSVTARLQGILSSSDRFSKLKINFVKRSLDEVISNRAGNQPGCTSIPADYRDVVCAWPFCGLFLNPELKAFLCCSDYKHELLVGDLNRQSLMEIWNGDALKTVRAAMLAPDRPRIPLCAKCDAEWWRVPKPQPMKPRRRSILEHV